MTQTITVVQCRAGDSQSGSDPDPQQDSERDAFVEVPVLHCHGHHQPPHKQHVGVLQVLHTHLENSNTVSVCSVPAECVCVCVCVIVSGLTSLDCMMPRTGNRMVGSSAVTGSGNTSVHQYTAMRAMT